MKKNKIFIIVMCFLLFTLYPLQIANCKMLEQKENVQINLCWWEKFNDPILVDYINKALNNNHDLKKAVLQVSESNQRVKEYFGKELPKLSVIPSYIGIKPPLFANDPNAVSQREQLFLLPLLANYEVDIFGKNRSNTKAQKELHDAVKQDTRSIYITLVSNVASSYFNIIQFDKLIGIQNCIIKADLEKIDILKSKYEIGLISYDDLLSAKSNLMQSQTQLNELCKQRDFFLNELMVLTGESPEDSTKCNLARTSIDEINLLSNIPTELCSNSILERPDILKSEANLRYAKINIDLARKAFLPNINIFGAIGFESIKINSLINIKEFLSSYGVLLQQEIFTGGQRRAKLKQKKFQYEELLEDYQSTILTSLQEVNNSMYSLKTNLKTDEANLKNLNFKSHSLELTNIRYKEGLASRLDTIEPCINVLVSEQNKVRSKTSYLIDSINLYKALGGKI